MYIIFKIKCRQRSVFKQRYPAFEARFCQAQHATTEMNKSARHFTRHSEQSFFVEHPLLCSGMRLAIFSVPRSMSDQVSIRFECLFTYEANEGRFFSVRQHVKGESARAQHDAVAQLTRVLLLAHVNALDVRF